MGTGAQPTVISSAGYSTGGALRSSRRAPVSGGGVAGAEAAYQLCRRGHAVTLREMKPRKTTPAHTTEYFAELCCSNSLRSDRIGTESTFGEIYT